MREHSYCGYALDTSLFHPFMVASAIILFVLTFTSTLVLNYCPKKKKKKVLLLWSIRAFGGGACLHLWIVRSCDHIQVT